MKIFLLFEIISISMIFCEFCGLNPPEDDSYCNINQPGGNEPKCCYCTNKETNEHYCFIDNTYDHNYYTCSCSGLKENNDLPGSKCKDHEQIDTTVEDDITEEKCHSLSIDKYPCCYYDDGINKKCFSIGKISSNTLYTYTGFLNCLSHYQQINYLFILIFFMLFLL